MLHEGLVDLGEELLLPLVIPDQDAGAEEAGDVLGDEINPQGLLEADRVMQEQVDDGGFVVHGQDRVVLPPLDIRGAYLR